TLSNSNIASPSAHQTIHGGRYDGFLAKFNGVGVRQWSSYYGGSEIDRAYAIHWDESGMLYLAGDTYSGTSIATNGSHQPVTGNRHDAFLAKFNEQGVRRWGTYYGGSLDDEARAVTTNSTGSVFVAGFASSTSQIATTHGP